MNKLQTWLQTTPYKDFELTEASVDASFRKYYRLQKANKSFIVMDSSLELSSIAPFLDVTSRLLKAQVKAPKIYEKNLHDGYLILEDFGNLNLLDVLNESNYKIYYLDAIDAIITMQNADKENLPCYDKEFLHFEMGLMQEWYLEKKLQIHLTMQQKNLLSDALEAISQVVLSQPQNIFVHRDFHSRNIMLTDNSDIAVIDYQDAMNGAITYDIVSLLKDCYIEFDRESVIELALLFRDKKGLDVSDAEFIKWFDFMGLQRHIKVLGVFSRLSLRDKKNGYLKDIPLVLKYTLDAARRYDETQELALLLEELTQ